MRMMVPAEGGESAKYTPDRKSLAFPTGALLTVVFGLSAAVVATPRGESAGSDEVMATFVEQWADCLGDKLDPDATNPALVTYDSASEVVTVRSSVVTISPGAAATRGYAPPEQPPDALKKANGGQLFTLRFKYAPSMPPGQQLQPAAPPDALMIFRTCIEPSEQHKRSEDTFGTLPHPPAR